jgi:hypothetical protein
VYKVVHSAHLSFSRLESQSSECPHATGSRNGRVAVGPRSYVELVVVAGIEDGPRPNDAPRFLNLPAHQSSVVLERPGSYEGVYEVRSTTGRLTVARRMDSNGSHGLARDEGYYDVGRLAPWHGPFQQGGALNQWGELLASATVAGAVRTLIASPDGQTPDRPIRPSYTSAEATPIHNAATQTRGWLFSVSEPGVGAIDADGDTWIALPSGRFLALLPGGDGHGEATFGLDATIDASATDLSIVPPLAMILYGGGDAGKLAADLGRTFTSSRLDARRVDGSLAWRSSVPFLAMQPPVDGNGLVYVIGAGIAAIDLEGRLLWSSPSNVPLRAQAFADGTLVVVRGREVQIVGNDATVRQSFRAAEELTSYPAIASDGSVWVASAKTLYVLR